MKKVIVIVGATGSGKTKLAIDIAKKYNGEIINADAFQVYKEISVGTAKANKEETKQVKFHLNGELSIYEPWDIAIFQERAKKIIDELIKNKKVPIIVGGSNLYIDALIYNYDLSAPARDEQYENFTTPDLYDKLIKLDKNVASTIDAHNRRRIIRALQIISNNGAFRKKNKPLYEPLIIYKEMPRELVYEKINNNVEKMIKNGWKEEIEKLYKKDKNVGKLNAFKAIGYPIILDAIENKKEIDVDLIKQKTRQYAKRQMTWIKYHYKDHFIFSQDSIQTLFKKIKSFL